MRETKRKRDQLERRAPAVGDRVELWTMSNRPAVGQVVANLLLNYEGHGDYLVYVSPAVGVSDLVFSREQWHATYHWSGGMWAARVSQLGSPAKPAGWLSRLAGGVRRLLVGGGAVLVVVVRGLL